MWAMQVLAESDSQDSFFLSVDAAEDVWDVAEGKQSSEWQWTVSNGRANGSPLQLNPR
jgi:hypothetical protein